MTMHGPISGNGIAPAAGAGTVAIQQDPAVGPVSPAPRAGAHALLEGPRRTGLRRRRRLVLALALATAGPTLAQAAEVNVYSYRQPDLIAPLLERFTAETGIEANVLFLDKGLTERIKAEGANSPADVILTVDIGRLTEAVEAGVTQAVDSEAIEAGVPEAYRDPADQWFGLTTRARVVYASKDRVEEDALGYEDLADPKYRGRICTRSGQHDYNLALFATMIERLGEEGAEAWLAGLRDNLVGTPDGNDRAQAQKIHSGECDIGLGNSYYLGLMATNEKEPEQKEWFESLKVIFPDAEGPGTHVNVSGMAMAANAPNREEALKLMEFLASPEAQEIYAGEVYEYPVAPGAEPSELVASFGTLDPDPTPLATIAGHRRLASELVDRVGYDDGPSS